ncbi:MAG TPA: tail fiber domain-containing protein, partial [Saprospiraceae bacterium]|nr:tail fiber domain-containing protein [Saprospiraceae bacterium]
GTYDNGMALGYSSTVTASNQVRIGNGAMMSIGGFVAWTNLSDARFKNNIKENVPGLDFILRLRPVTYQLDIPEINRFMGVEENEESMPVPLASTEQVRTGFLAQEVEEAALASGFDFDGIDKPQNQHDLYGLRYAEFTVPLVKAVQEQQTQITLLDARIKDLEERNHLLESKLAELDQFCKEQGARSKE